METENFFVNNYFTRAELACKGNGNLLLAKNFLGELIQLRTEWGQPMRINSCYRSPDYNSKIGGAKGSRHTHGDAIDVAMANGNIAWDFVKLAIGKNWSVGVYKTFIHIDRRPSSVIWAG